MLDRLFVFSKTAAILAVFFAVGLGVASAQAGERDQGELAAYGGAGLGAGTHGVVGGSAGVAFSRYGMGLFDFSFMPMGKNTIQSWPASSTVNHSLLYDFGVDFHIRVPIKERWEPYAIVGAGLLWNSLHQDSTTPQGVPVVNHYNQFNGALHTGGGVRFFAGKSWGVRPEVKVIVSKQIYTRISMGIFFVTPPDWP